MHEDLPAIDAINQSIKTAIENNNDAVTQWIVNTPGSWGYLSGQAVMTCRKILFRPLTAQERRLLWHVLWVKLTVLKHSKSSDSQVALQSETPES